MQIIILAFTLEDELPDYDCDDEDSNWLESFNKKNPKDIVSVLEFERIIDTLEKGCGSRLDVSNFLLGWLYFSDLYECSIYLLS